MDKCLKVRCFSFDQLPVFLDVHKVPFTEEHLKELCNAPVDEFGVSHVNLLYNKEANVCFCILDAPDVAAVENHHNKAGVKCEWITEVNLAKAVPSNKS